LPLMMPPANGCAQKLVAPQLGTKRLLFQDHELNS
jgi:hypothetical protein